MKNSPQECLSKYSKKIFNFVLRMTGNKSSAEDITQETLLQAIQKADSFRGDSDIITWLFAIAKNQCYKEFNKTNPATFRDIEELIATVSTATSNPSYSETEKKIYIQQVKEGCLLGLLRCLPHQQRTAFTLHILFSCSIKETAVVLEKTENATRILTHRARNKIKNFLCKNCSLYDNKNHCHCEGLIDFSLKQGWIGQEKDMPALAIIEKELHAFGDEILLFRTLPNREPPESLKERLQNFIQKNNFHIFSKKSEINPPLTDLTNRTNTTEVSL